MKKISLLILCCSIISLTAFAQKNNCAQLKEMKAELKTHYTTQMTPELQTIHANLMSQLSEEDQAAVKKLQEKQNALVLKKKSLKKAAKNSEEAAINKQSKQDLKSQQKAINQALKPIVQRNKAAIEAANQAMKTKNIAWRTERKTIKDKYYEYECVQLALQKKAAKGQKKSKAKQRVKPRNKNGNPPKANKRGKDKKKKKAGAFLLWTPKGNMMPQSVKDTDSTN